MDVIKKVPKFATEGSYVSPEGDYHDGDTIYDKVNNQGYRMRRANLEQETEGGQKQTDWLNSVVRGSRPIVTTDGGKDGLGRFLSRDFVRTPYGDVDLNLLSFASGQAVWDESFGSHGINEDELSDYSAYSRRTYKGKPPEFERFQWVQTNKADNITDRKFEKQLVKRTEVDDFDIQQVDKQMKYLEFMRQKYAEGVIEKDQWLAILGKTMTGNSGKRIHAVNWLKNQSGKPSAVTSIDEEVQASETGRTGHVNAPLNRSGMTVAGTLRSMTGMSTSGETTKLESGLHVLNPLDHLTTFAQTVKANLDKRGIEGFKVEDAIKHLPVVQQMTALEINKTRGNHAAVNAISNMDKALEHEITQSQTGTWEGLGYMAVGALVNPLTPTLGVTSGVVTKGMGAVSARYLPKIVMEKLAQAEGSAVAQSLIGRTVKTSVESGIHAGTFAGIASMGNYLPGVNPEFTVKEQGELMLGMAEMGLMFGAGGHLLGEGYSKVNAMRAEKKAAREALAVDVKSIKQIDESIAVREQAVAEEAARKPAEKKTPEEKTADKVAEIEVVQAEHEADLVDAVQTEAELMQEVMTVPEPTIEPIMSDLGLPEEASVEGKNVTDYTMAPDTVTDVIGEEFTVDNVEGNQVHISNEEGNVSGAPEQFTKVEPKVEEGTETVEPEHAFTVAQNMTEQAVAQLHVTTNDLNLVTEAFAPVEKELKTEFPEEAAVSHDGNWRPDRMFPENKVAGQHVGVFGKLGNKLNKLNAKQLLNTGRLAVDHILNFKLKELNRAMGKLSSKGLTKEMAKQVNWLMNNNTVKRKVDLLKVLEMDAITASQDIAEALKYFETVEKIKGFATVEDLNGVRIGSIGGLEKAEMEKAGLFDKEGSDDEGFADSIVAPEDSRANANIEEQVNSLGDKRNEEFRTALINRIELTREKIKEYQKNWDMLWNAEEGKPRGGLPASQVKGAKDMAALRLRNAQELMNSLEQLAGVFVQKMEALEVQKMSEGLDSVAIAEGALEDFRYKWKLFSLSKEQKLIEINKLEKELGKDLSFEEEADIEFNISILKTNMEDEIARTNMKANIINLGKAAEERMQIAIKQQGEFKKSHAEELENKGIKASLKFKPVKLTVDLSAVDIVNRGKSSAELDRLLDVKRDLKEEVETPDTALMRTAFMNSERFDFGDEAEINRGLKDWIDALIVKQQGLIEGHGRSKAEAVKQKLIEEFGELKDTDKFAHKIIPAKSQGTVERRETDVGKIQKEVLAEAVGKLKTAKKELTDKLNKNISKPVRKELERQLRELENSTKNLSVKVAEEVARRIKEVEKFNKTVDERKLTSRPGKDTIEWKLNKGKREFTERGEQYFLRKKELEGSKVFERNQKQELTGALRYEVGKFGEEGVESSDTSVSRQVIDAEKGYMGQDDSGNGGLNPDEFGDIDVRQIHPLVEVQRPSNMQVKIQEIEEVLFGKEKTQDSVKFTVDTKTGKMTMEGDFGKKYDGDAFRNQKDWTEDSLAAKLHAEEYVPWKMLPENRNKDFKQWAWERFRELKDYRFDNPNYKRIANELKNEAIQAWKKADAEKLRREGRIPEDQIERMVDLRFEGKEWDFEPTKEDVQGRYEQDKGDYTRGRELEQTQRYVNPYVHGVMKELELTRTTSLMKLKRENASEKAITISDFTYRVEKLLEERVELETEEAFNARKPEFEPGRVYTETEMLTGLDEKGLVNNVKDLGNKNWGGANKESFNIIENKVIDEMAKLQEELNKKTAEFEANKKPKKKKFKPETKRTRAEAERKRLQKEGIVADKTFVEALSEAIEATDRMLKEEQKAITEQAKINIAEGGSETWSANELIEFRKNLEKAIDIEKLIKGHEIKVLVKEVNLGKTNADIAEETTTAVSDTKPPCK